MAVTSSPLAADVTGPVWNVTMLLAIVPERRHDLSDALAGLEHDSPFAVAPSVHLARLVVLDAVPARRAGPPATVALSPARLLFGATVDAGLAVLVDELLPAQADALRPVFGCCVGCPDLADRAGFLGWLEAHRVPADISFATIAAPATRIRRALIRRDRLAALVGRGRGLTPAELRAAFAEVTAP